MGLRTSPLRILFASSNSGKAREVRAILNLPDLEIVTPSELGQSFDVVESGTTFEENARLKALAALRLWERNLLQNPKSKIQNPKSRILIALADDSGLEIDALGGRPGVQSARFMGERSSYEQKYLEILRLMVDVPEGRRTARFRCCAVLAERGEKGEGRRDESVRAFEGVCEGTIAFEPRGSGGFGYDPIFVPDGFAQTFAELPPEVKNQISHRARAFFLVRQYLSAEMNRE